MGQYSPPSYQTIFERINNRIIARTSLTSLAEGDDPIQISAAVAREVDDLHYQNYLLRRARDVRNAEGDDLDELAAELLPPAVYPQLSRREAQFATGQVLFSRQGTTGAITIDVGTVVFVPGTTYRYRTTETATIPNGSTTASSATSITAEQRGADYNAEAGTITAFSSRPSGVDYVTNSSSLENGQDRQSDADFRRVIYAWIASLARCHVKGVTFAALTASLSTGQYVKFANIVEDPANPSYVSVYIDDGAGSANNNPTTYPSWTTVLASAVGGETVVTVPNVPIDVSAGYTFRHNTSAMTEGTDYSLNPATGQMNLLPGGVAYPLSATDAIDGTWTKFSDLITETQKIIDGDPSDYVTYPGYRAAGVLVRVLPPNSVSIVVTGNVSVLQNFSQTDVLAKCEAAVSGYINSLDIGEDVVLNEIRERIMAVPGVYDVALSAPTGNRIIGPDSIARISSSNLSLT